MVGLLMAGAGVAGGGLNIFGNLMASEQQRKDTKYNAKLMDMRAEAVEQAMSSDTTAAHESARELKGAQRAAAAKSGAQIGSGTPLVVLAEQAGKMEQDIMEQRRTQMIQAQGLRSGADQLRHKAKMIQKAGYLNAFGSALRLGSSAGSAISGGMTTGGTQSGVSGSEYERMFPGVFN